MTQAPPGLRTHVWEGAAGCPSFTLSARHCLRKILIASGTPHGPWDAIMGKEITWRRMAKFSRTRTGHFRPK